MARVLIVDDDPQVRGLLSAAFAARGHDVLQAATAAEGLALGSTERPDAAVLDIRLPDFSGHELGARLRASGADVPAIAITGFGSDADAAACLNEGFQDYIDKPFRPFVLVSNVEGLLTRRAVAAPATPSIVHRPPATALRPATMVGSSQPMQRVYEEIARAAATDHPVLITGETGTGKDLAARAIHDASARKSGPFVAVNCATGSTLFESQCFGHERGAFTDARERHAGWFEQAHGGTLFLDEIGETPLDAQAKLLRVIETPQVTRLAGTRSLTVDVRLIFATNAALESKIAAGVFRRDLYHRLDVLRVSLPSLRDHRDDILDLAASLLAGVDDKRPAPMLTEDAVHALQQHDWPGNVRELRQVLVRAHLHARDGRITAPQIQDASGTRPTAREEGGTAGLIGTLREAVAAETQRIEREMIRVALAQHNTLSGAAAFLGIDRRTLYTKMIQHGVNV